MSLEDLKQRYKLKTLRVSHEQASMSLVSDDADFYPLVAAILQLPVEPFTDSEFQSKTHAFCEKIGIMHHQLLGTEITSAPKDAGSDAEDDDACQRLM